MPQDQRCLARPDAYGAVGDDAALGDHSVVLEELPQLCRVLECAVGCAQKVGVQMHGAGDECRRSEEHTSELQSHLNLVCRLLLEKKKMSADTKAEFSSAATLVIVNIVALIAQSYLNNGNLPIDLAHCISFTLAGHLSRPSLVLNT